MKGEIKVYFEDKLFGFIKGDDGKEYFFHKKQFKNINNENLLKKYQRVSFQTESTQKGLAAKLIDFIKNEQKQNNEDLYTVPDSIYTSKTNKVNGWDTLETSDWTISCEGSNVAIDDIKEEVMQRARNLGANAVVNLRYSKRTDSEISDSGRGTHYYSVHSFTGIPVNIGKKSRNGIPKKKIISDINENCSNLKEILLNKSSESSKTVTITWGIVLSVCTLLCIGAKSGGNDSPIGYIITAVAVFLTFIFARSTDYDSWLQKYR